MKAPRGNLTVSDQVSWNLGISYDELRDNIIDACQTPFQGSMGGNSFTLPKSFGTALPGHEGLQTDQMVSVSTDWQNVSGSIRNELGTSYTTP